MGSYRARGHKVIKVQITLQRSCVCVIKWLKGKCRMRVITRVKIDKEIMTTFHTFSEGVICPWLSESSAGHNEIALY